MNATPFSPHRTRALLRASLAATSTARTVTDEYHRVLRRAQSVVASEPYLMDCGVKEPNTFFHLVVGDHDAVLTWIAPGAAVQRCRFPAAMLEGA
jgi:hypothetical protein